MSDDYDCCENPNVLPYRGILVCQNCGMVHGSVFADTPKRAFTEEEIASRRQTEPVYRSIGPRTVISKLSTDITGAPLSGKTKSLFWRLAKIQRSVTSTFERNLSVAQPKLFSLASTLGFPHTVVEEALRIYSKAVKKKLTMGRSIQNLVAASLLISSKLHDIPRSMEEIAQAAQIPVKNLSKAYRLLLNRLKITIKATTPSKFVNRFAAELKLSHDVQMRAQELLELSGQRMSIAGKDPKGLAAAALYIAGKELGESRSQSDLAKVAHVSEVTLRNRAKNIKAALE
ncbi:MAG: transcription initiation factor IIB [Candidatus Helarchaeota archaeon]